MVTVSVIVPSYNYGRFLAARLQSILEQTYQHIEVIVIDDASTDDSRAVIDTFSRDPRVRAIYCDSNSGSVYQRWNEAALVAGGRYLWFAGADDYCELNLLEELLQWFDRQPTVGIAFARSWMITESGKRLVLAPTWTRTGFYSGGRAMRRLVLDTTIATASAVAVRADLYREVGGFDTRFPLAADWRFYVDVLARSDLAYVAKPLNFCRVHPATVSVVARRSGAESLERYRVLEDLWNRYPSLRDLRDEALDREAERCLLHAANTFRRGSFNAALRILSSGAGFDQRHTQRLLRALPSLLGATGRLLSRRGKALLKGSPTN
jgi:glycosyltransferase involved in cell wall biosynthesis